MNINNIEFKEMSFCFQGESDPLFKNISFTFPRDPVVRLSRLLPGKSTLLKIMAGLIPVSGGAYFIDGEDVSQMSFEEFLPLRMKIGYSFDFGGLLNNRTILENLLLPLQYHRRFNSESEARVRALMERFNIERSQHLRPFAVPGAHRKAACLIRAFVNDPDLILLDEPDAGLKDEAIAALCFTIEESMEKYNLQRLIYSSDHPLLEKRLGPTEVYLGGYEIGDMGISA